MTSNIFAVLLLLSMIIHGGNCRTIDEIIVAAEQEGIARQGVGDNSSCQDTHLHCVPWAARGECSNSPAYMRDNCKRSCNMCSGSSSSSGGASSVSGAASSSGGGGNSNCQDDNANCAFWAANSVCLRNPAYMHVKCKKSCNICRSSGGGASSIGGSSHSSSSGGTSSRSAAASSSTAAISSVCSDQIEDCDDYVGSGACIYDYFKDNCKDSCNLCPSSDLGLSDSYVKVELDMVFKTEDYRRILRVNAEIHAGRKKRKAIRNEMKRWTNNVVPYNIDSGFSPDDKAHIQAAIDDWELYTCITFRPYKKGSDQNYINIQDGKGCRAIVGMQGGRQGVTLGTGCRDKKIIIHELGHALGFWHEQNRPDREQYIKVLDNNVEKGQKMNFIQYDTDYINNHDVQYDYLSIMHYGKTAFSKNNKSITIRTLDPAFQDIIGNQTTLSFKDIKLANLMYRCASHCKSKTCPGYGFLGKDCECHGSGVRHADFTLVPNFCQKGGIMKHAYGTEESCLAHCAADAKCVAIDWNIESRPTKPRCEFQYEEYGACAADTGKKSTHYRHYRYTETSRCFGWRTTTTTTTTTTTPRPTARPTWRPRPRPTWRPRPRPTPRPTRRPTPRPTPRPPAPVHHHYQQDDPRPDSDSGSGWGVLGAVAAAAVMVVIGLFMFL